ncbi:uncharacterized protein CANTADRAFT_3686 [Suhomyces tanzawaensis NRRL Y-17324]|uniref:Uncharacterized protein n=1 Tax=Suhomyces tanzawaensis NRRL Y-17324 TaxID=984487 RepID=A0A1E4SQ00_9ASCO|nr:uncharacterized protein CANTADRAFT_3686 [Suhomyces tanzawaensis NRRL Y-17324]ODV81593.1 hypothetical protein CANTADRAFT_3686 [Suhomyces tanzawaensis NRRL Y-17324]
MNTQVLPPANGKKLWRVKRSVSAGHLDTDSHSQSSLECLNNSLKISAAASKFSIRRPPLRRPKNRPGKPKDFVFVDLSPVKNEDCATFCDASSTNSPTQSPLETPPSSTSFTSDKSMFDLPQLNESFSLLSDSDSIFSAFDRSASNEQNYIQDTHSIASSVSQHEDIGLGIMGLDVQNWEQNPNFNERPAQQQAPQIDNAAFNQQLYGYQHAMMEQHKQIQMLKQQLQEQQAQKKAPLENLHKRSKSASVENPKRRGSGQFQFKSYTGPKKGKAMKLRRTVSEPSRKSTAIVSSVSAPTTPEVEGKPHGLEDFTMFNDQFMTYKDNAATAPAQTQSYETFTPVSEFSDDDFSLPKNYDVLSGCGIDQFLLQKQDDLFAGFVPL